MSDPNLVILAAGASSRMRKRPAATPPVDPSLLREAAEGSKALIGIGDGHRPLLDYLLYNAREAGYRDVVIVTGENDAAFRLHYGSADRANPFHGLAISYAVQRIPAGRRKPGGTTDALLQALRSRPDWRGRKFTVCNSDNLYSSAALNLLLDDPHSGAMIEYDRDALSFDAQRISQFAVVRRAPDGFVAAIVEKPVAGVVAASARADGRVGVSMNIFRFSYDRILPALERVPFHPVRDEKDLPQAIMLMLAGDPQGMMTIPLAESVPDLTSQEDIARVQAFVKREFPNFSFDPT